MRRSRIWTPSDGQGLVGFWPMLEGGGPTIRDFSPNGNHGTITGATWNLTPTRQGLTFDGIDDSVNFGAGASLNLSASAFTVILWLYPNEAASSNLIVGHRLSSPYEGYGLYFNTTTLKLTALYRDATVIKDVVALTAIPQAGWSHITQVVSPTANQIYINGVLDATTVLTGLLTTGQFTLYAARAAGVGNPKCSIKNIRIFNRTLTAPEIKNIYTSER